MAAKTPEAIERQKQREKDAREEYKLLGFKPGQYMLPPVPEARRKMRLMADQLRKQFCRAKSKQAAQVETMEA